MSTLYATRGRLERGAPSPKCRGTPFFCRMAPGAGSRQPAESSSAFAAFTSYGGNRSVVSANEIVRGNGPYDFLPTDPYTFCSIACLSSAIDSARRTLTSPKIGCGRAAFAVSTRLKPRNTYCRFGYESGRSVL